MRTVIVYDIVDDRTRDKVARVLEEYAVRVQKSVFEAPVLSENRFLRLRSDLEGLIDHATDSLRYYRVCAACGTRITHVGAGTGLLPLPEPFRII